ncbi:MAG: hypothetical protein A2X36_10380 [Elusimicrobia bacterium GWA2_69_24]|nr:MAG: hypothetical protein A2X36_10380 [Elusimicrobia bacterium GWA2_69_24]
MMQLLLALLLMPAVLSAGPAGSPSGRAAATFTADDALAVEWTLELPEGTPAVFAVDLAGVEGLADLRVAASGKDGAKALAFDVNRAGAIRWVRWTGGAGRYLIGYRLSGVLRRGRDRDTLRWSVVPEGLPYGFAAVNAELKIDGALASCSDWDAVQVMSPAQVTRRASMPDGFLVEARSLPARAGLSLSVGMPKGTVPSTWRPVGFMKRRGGALLLFVLPLLTLCALAFVFWTRGRDPLVSGAWEGTAAALPEQEVWTPETAGVVADESADHRDVIAAALDLAREGVLGFAFTPARGGVPASLRISGAKPFAALPPTRRKIAEFLSGVDAITAEAGLSAQSVGVLQDALYEEASASGCFRMNPARERWYYYAAGAVLLAAGFALAVYGGTRLATSAGAAALWFLPVLAALGALRAKCPCLQKGLAALAGVLLVLAAASIQPYLGMGGLDWYAMGGLGLVFSSLCFFLFAPLMPQRTAKGSAMKSQLLAFDAWLGGAAPGAGGRPVQEEFERMLPYAVVFRRKKEWVNRAAAAGAQVPAWWTPAGAEAAAGALSEHKEPFLESLSLLSSAIGEPPESGGGG